MEREPQRRQRVPLGEKPKIVRVSEEEMHLAYLHREKTGEPIQSWVRRLMRENWNRGEPHGSCEEGTTGVLVQLEPVVEIWRSTGETFG